MVDSWRPRARSRRREGIKDVNKEKKWRKKLEKGPFPVPVVMSLLSLLWCGVDGSRSSGGGTVRVRREFLDFVWFTFVVLESPLLVENIFFLLSCPNSV